MSLQNRHITMEDTKKDKKNAQCGILIIWDGISCPCRGKLLRINPRVKNSSKPKLAKIKRI